MNQRSHLSVVRVDDAPPPPLPVDIDLKGMPKVLIDRAWLHDSRRRAVATSDEMIAAIDLFDACIDQKPSGSLPSDDAELAMMTFYGRDKAGWFAVKARALDGWVLCSDGRYYHEEVSKQVLDSWIKCVVGRRKSHAGNCSRRKAAFDPSLYDQAIARAVAALAQIDPYAPILRSHKVAAPDIASGSFETAPIAASSSPPSTASSIPPSTPNGTERNGTDSSSPLRGDDLSGRENQPDLELGLEGGSSKRTDPIPIRRERAAPWPPGWFGIFRARGYPQRDNMAWGRAEKALDKIRKAQCVPFEDILAGVDRLAAQVRAGTLQLRYVPLPSTWLNDRGWEDKAAPRSGQPPPSGRPPAAPPGSEPSITQRAAMLAAERLGLLDKPRPRG